MPRCRLFGIIVVTLGCLGITQSAVAADMRAVERGLGYLVSKGDLSLREANLMFEALRRSNSHDGYERRAKMEGIHKEIRLAVQNGDLTEEEARKKMEAVRREFRAQRPPRPEMQRRQQERRERMGRARERAERGRERPERGRDGADRGRERAERGVMRRAWA